MSCGEDLKVRVSRYLCCDHMDGICEASPEGTCYRHLYEDQAIDILEIVVEECSKVADEEADAMDEQRTELLEKGSLGGRNVPEDMRRGFAFERKILIEGYENIARAIRALKRTKQL